MNLGIYCNAGTRVGYGHLKRCLSIAKELTDLFWTVTFYDAGHLDTSLVEKNGFHTERLETSLCKRSDIILVDDYDINETMMMKFRKHCRLLARIDDAAPHVIEDHISDLIINGNPYANSNMYNHKTRKDCTVLAGPQFIPIDKTFEMARRKYRIRREISHITITFGGTRKGQNYALTIAHAIAQNFSSRISILNGVDLRGKSLCYKNIRLLPFVDAIENIFIESDLVICSASSTCWQLSAIGIPFIAFQIADNQSLAYDFIKNHEMGVALEWEGVKNGILSTKINDLTCDKRKRLSKISRSIVDCNGAKRIANKMDFLALENSNRSLRE